MNKAALGVATPEEIASLAAGGLYDPAHEKDACGVGFVAHIKGQKAHGIVEQGLKILAGLKAEHLASLDLPCQVEIIGFKRALAQFLDSTTTLVEWTIQRARLHLGG